jgi:hypothetical protein
MNIPLMKTNGNLNRLEIIMMFEGTLVGGVEKSVPK